MKNNKYETFKERERMKSEILANDLNIFEKDFMTIQNWFDLLLLKHEEATNDRDEQLSTEKELEAKFNELISSEIEKKSYKYILPKLLNYNNIFNDDYLRSLFIARLVGLLRDKLIPRFVNDKSIAYLPKEFLCVIVYLKDNHFVSPNSNFLEDILKIESVRGIFKNASAQIKFETLKNILHIIFQKTFHHDIICFKKILKLVSETDLELMDYLEKFQVENDQGCYKIIHEILNLHLFNDKWEDFEIKVQLISFFDTAKGARPSLSWNKKFNELSVKVTDDKFKLIVHSVLKNEALVRYKFDYGAEWTDDTAKRFLKSAEWIRELV